MSASSAQVIERLLFTLGSRRLGVILYLARFIVRLSPMCCMLSLWFVVELGDGHMLEPIPFLACRAVHGHIAGRRSVGPMKMVEACLPTVRLRFDTKCAFDALTDKQQL